MREDFRVEGTSWFEEERLDSDDEQVGSIEQSTCQSQATSGNQHVTLTDQEIILRRSLRICIVCS